MQPGSALPSMLRPAKAGRVSRWSIVIGLIVLFSLSSLRNCVSLVVILHNCLMRLCMWSVLRLIIFVYRGLVWLIVCPIIFECDSCLRRSAPFRALIRKWVTFMGSIS